MDLKSQASPATAGADPTRHQARVVLTVLSAAAFMASLDLFIVNVAFHNIQEDFRGTSLSDLSWVLNAYAILYAALLVPLGRLADRYGRKAGFLLGLGLFTLGSAACAASTDPWMLVAFRGVQAIGAAALTPTSLALLLNATPAAGRVKAVRIWAATGALAAAAGPVIGGLLVSASWRWVFLVNVPIGVAALVAAIRVVPDSPTASSERSPDLAGSGLLVVAIGALALSLVKGTGWGWGDPKTLAGFAVTVVGLAVFWRRCTTHPSPVIQPALLKVRAFAWSNVTAIAFTTAFAAFLLLPILWMQDVWGWSALRTGLAIAPGPLMVPIFAAVAQSLTPRVSVGRIAALGCVFSALGGVLVLRSVGPSAAYASEILPGWLIGGMGVGLALPTILSAATADLPPTQAATGSGVVNMSRQVGSVIGVSLVVAFLGTPVGYQAAHRAFVHGWWAAAIAAVVGAFAAFGMTPRGLAPAGSPSTAKAAA